MAPAANEARAYNVPQWVQPYGTAPTSSSADLLSANAAPNSTLIFVDRWEKANERGMVLPSQGTVVIGSSLVLTKPLVLSGSVGISIAQGAVLTLAAQPVLPNKQVFSGAGAVKFQPGSTAEFYVVPEWWGGASASDRLDQIAAACADVRCLVVLRNSMGLRRPWRINPNLLPWSGPNAELHPEGGNSKGVVLDSGAYNPSRRIDLPRLQSFQVAVELLDVTGVWLYLHNIKSVQSAVTLSPRVAIKDTQVEAYSVVDSNNIFTIQPAAGGQPLLQNVYLRSYMLVKAAAGVSNINWFKGCPTLVNVTIENSLLNGKHPQSSNHMLRSDCPAGVAGLNYRVTTMNYAHPNGWSVVTGRFYNLTAYVRLGQDLASAGGTVSWQGSGNTLVWGGLDMLTKPVAMSVSPSPGTQPMTANSNLLSLPTIGSWPANTVMTFYAYHVMLGGDTDGTTMSVGPSNQFKSQPAQRKLNPGIVVEGVTDEGRIAKHRVAIRLRNVSGRTLTPAEISTVQFRLLIGVPNLAKPQPARRG